MTQSSLTAVRSDIWRIDPEGGEPERVAGDLGVPDSVKFDSQGFIVSTQVYSGEVLRIDPRTGARTVLAALPPGLDNCTFVGDRLFVSSFTGEITEILDGGQTRTTLPGGLNWPLDLAVDENGDLYIADWTYFYALRPGGRAAHTKDALPARLSWPPARCECRRRRRIHRYHRQWRGRSVPPREWLQRNHGAGLRPTLRRGARTGRAHRAAEFGTGRVLSVRSGHVEVLASGLREPVGVAFGQDGICYASESGAGRVVSITDSGVDTVVEGLDKPQGILIRDGQLYVVDVGAKVLITIDLATEARDVIARELPVGAPPGVIPKPLRGIPPFFGPEGPFAGIAAGPDGTLYLSADAEGSVLALRKVE